MHSIKTRGLAKTKSVLSELESLWGISLLMVMIIGVLEKNVFYKHKMFLLHA